MIRSAIVVRAVSFIIAFIPILDVMMSGIEVAMARVGHRANHVGLFPNRGDLLQNIAAEPAAGFRYKFPLISRIATG